MNQQTELNQENIVDITKRTGWALEMDWENLPDAICRLPFAMWTAEPRGEGKVNKIPRHPRGGWKLKVSESQKWVTYAEARRAYEAGLFDGVGVLLTADAQIVGIDLDDWGINSKDNQNIQVELKKFLASGGYMERSPSGNGFRAFMKGVLPPGRRKKGGIEIYCDQRFLTVTGHKVEIVND